mgnify:CR=1 FL=1
MEGWLLLTQQHGDEGMDGQRMFYAVDAFTKSQL